MEQHADIQENVKMVKIPTDLRKLGDDAVVPPDIAEAARSCAGSLAWYARETRPDCADDAVIIQGFFPDITVGQVVSLNKAAKKMRHHNVSCGLCKCKSHVSIIYRRGLG